uniref:Uncharacterized protein n=1 Tax=Eutreptiella gymnastica TaxID=73025 RepID=A0A7S4CRT6_9EUGL
MTRNTASARTRCLGSPHPPSPGCCLYRCMGVLLRLYFGAEGLWTVWPGCAGPQVKPKNLLVTLHCKAAGAGDLAHKGPCEPPMQPIGGFCAYGHETQRFRGGLGPEAVVQRCGFD